MVYPLDDVIAKNNIIFVIGAKYPIRKKGTHCKIIGSGEIMKHPIEHITSHGLKI